MLQGYKTYVTGTLAVLAAVGAYLTGDLTAVQALTAGLLALQQMFLRSGVTTEIRKASEVP